VVEAFDVTEVCCYAAYDNVLAQISWALKTSSTNQFIVSGNKVLA